VLVGAGLVDRGGGGTVGCPIGKDERVEVIVQLNRLVGHHLLLRQKCVPGGGMPEEACVAADY